MYLEDSITDILRQLREIRSEIEKIKLEPQPELMDNQDAMQMLKVSSRTLQNYRDLGILPYSKFEGKIYYKRSEIMRAIEEY